MNKTELIDITAEDSGIARDDAAKVIDSMLMTVTNTLASPASALMLVSEPEKLTFAPFGR